MMQKWFGRLFVGIAVVITSSFAATAEEAKTLRVGMIGCDTSHAPKFADLLAKLKSGSGPVRVVAALPAKSDDLAASYERVEKFTEDLRKQGVEIVDSVEALLPLVDAVMIESVDGRKHLEQLTMVVAAGKPVFIDKPVAGSLADAIAIFDLAKQHGTPCFSSSSLRFSGETQAAAKAAKAGPIVGCAVFSPCKIEPTHPDLFWYGIHGVEMLFAIMGPGCESVSRTQTDSGELVVGVWKDRRIGTYRGIKQGPSRYGATVFGTKQIAYHPVSDTGYASLMEQVAQFLRTGKTPVDALETVEIFAFMEAADESKRRGGAPVKLADVIQQARAKAAQ